MTPDEQQAAETLRTKIQSRFPDLSPTVGDGAMGVTISLGVDQARFSEIEAAMQDATMEVMLDSGVLVMLSP